MQAPLGASCGSHRVQVLPAAQFSGGHSLLLPMRCRLSRPGGGVVVCTRAGKGSKGFGANVDSKPDRQQKSGGKKQSQSRGTPTRQPSVSMLQQPRLEDTQLYQVQAMEEEARKKAEDDEFASRLTILKQQAAERQAEKEAAAAAAVASSLATPVAGAAPPSGSSTGGAGSAPSRLVAPAAFDAREDIYANPPPLMKTIMGTRTDDSISDPKLREAPIGPSQLAVAAGAVIFGAIFLLVSTGDYAVNKRFKGVTPAQAPPDPIEEKILKSKVSLYEERLKTNPDDEASLESLSVAYAKLFEFTKAQELLGKLTAKQPNNFDAWRLLGESSLLAEDSRRAVEAYEKAIALRPLDFQALPGLVDAYIADSKQAKAVDLLKGVREQLAGAGSSGTAAAAGATAAATAASTAAGVPTTMLPAPALEVAPEASAAGEAAAPAESASADSAATPSTSASSSGKSRVAGSPSTPFDDVSVDLLLAKVFGSWRGHDSDAFAVYDKIIAEHRGDYRGYLAKGVFLKEKGRRADADRMFIQARYYAPAARQQLVKAVSDFNPVVDVPDNNS